MAGRNWAVICISGVTCGGKTTVTKLLHERYQGSIIISQDDYFLPKDSSKHTLIPELNHFNWDILTAFDMERMKKDVSSVLSSKCESKFPVVLIEGVLVLNDEELCRMCDRKYFLTLPYEVCAERRRNRTYDPPDVSGYFEMCVWPEYLKSKEIAMHINPDICVIDGMTSVNVILEAITNDIQKLLDDINNGKN